MRANTTEEIIFSDGYEYYLLGILRKLVKEPNKWKLEFGVWSSRRSGNFDSFAVSVIHEDFGVLAATPKIYQSNPYSNRARRKVIKAMKRAQKAYDLVENAGS